MDESHKNERNWLHLFATLFAIGFPTLVTLVYFKWLADEPGAAQQMAYGIGKFLQFAFPIVWVWIFFRYRIGRDRTRPETKEEKTGVPSSIPNWLWAVGFGIDVCLVMAAAWWFLSGGEQLAAMTAKVQDKVNGLGITQVWQFALLGLFYALVHSFLEEYYWRWFVYDMLKRFVTVPMANLISSLGFMAHHVILLNVYFGWSWMTFLCSAGVAIGGMYWAWLYEKSRTLLWPWVSHMVVDAGIFALGYFLIF
jgi:membrane protease YdiL (CAAX protease family)